MGNPVVTAITQRHVLEQVRRALLLLGPHLEEAAAIGACGSLVRPGKWTEHSDIDVFVVVEHLQPGDETHCLWDKRIRQALDQFDREVTVLVYPRRGLEKISNWYVLRLASEGILVYDQGNIAQLFTEILSAAIRAGLVEDEIDGVRYWRKENMRLGEIFEVKLR